MSVTHPALTSFHNAYQVFMECQHNFSIHSRICRSNVLDFSSNSESEIASKLLEFRTSIEPLRQKTLTAIADAIKLFKENIDSEQIILPSDLSSLNNFMNQRILDNLEDCNTTLRVSMYCQAFFPTLNSLKEQVTSCNFTSESLLLCGSFTS